MKSKKDYVTNPFQNKYKYQEWTYFDSCSCFIGIVMEDDIGFTKFSPEIQRSIVMSCLASHVKSLKTRIKDNKLQVLETFWRYSNG